MLTVMLVGTAFAQHCQREEYGVGIDVGHSIEMPGAVSARGTSEFFFNRRLAGAVVTELWRRGFTKAFLINEKGASVSLAQRTDVAREHSAQVFISIHHDSVKPRFLSLWTYKGKRRLYSDKFHGYSIFYSDKNKSARASLDFARLLGAELRSHGFEPTLHHAEKIAGENRELVDREKGIYRFDDLVVLRTAEMPAVLFEAGVIVNRQEEGRLIDPGYQSRLAVSVARSVTNLCEEKGNSAKLAWSPKALAF
jgi:N-acetylmuramoyl-L-alanine amidase